MGKKLNPAAVGIFVVGAVVILVASLIAMGTAKFFEKRGRFVAYFQTSANGLQVGSDVLLGGVKVGSVVDMRVQFDPNTGKKVIPVTIELSADRIIALSADTDTTTVSVLSEESLKRAIEEQGLRARLLSKSALTGQLYVDLEFFPGDSSGYVFPGDSIDGLVQIPSVKSEIQQVLEKLAEGLEGVGQIDLVSMVNNFDTLVTNFDAKIAELDLEGISDRTKSALESVDATFLTIDDSLADDQLKSIIANVNDAASELKDLIVAVDVGTFNSGVKTAKGAFVTFGDASDNIKALTDERAAAIVSLNRALAGIEGATRSIEALADYLRRNPNALISGKKQP